MVSFVRHSDQSKFSERTTCLHIRGLSMSPLYSENRVITGYTCSKAALNRPKEIFILDRQPCDYIRGCTIVLSTMVRQFQDLLVIKMSHSKSPECWAIIWPQVPE